MQNIVQGLRSKFDLLKSKLGMEVYDDVMKVEQLVQELEVKLGLRADETKDIVPEPTPQTTTPPSA